MWAGEAGCGRWEGVDAGGKVTSLVHGSNAEPHKAGHGVPLALAQRLQLAAEHLVWGGGHRVRWEASEGITHGGSFQHRSSPQSWAGSPACLGKEVHPLPVTISCREQAEGKYWSQKTAYLVLGNSTLSLLKFSHPGNKLVPRSGMQTKVLAETLKRAPAKEKGTRRPSPSPRSRPRSCRVCKGGLLAISRFSLFRTRFCSAASGHRPAAASAA